MEIKDSTPLKWPDGWSRTLIDQRKTQASWKKTFSFYRNVVEKELKLMGASMVMISRNELAKERQDPGVAVWFALKPTEDFSWQAGLHIDNPAPSLEDIDRAFKQLARVHHPDAVASGSGGDVKLYYRLDEYRKKARAWVLGTTGQADNCIPMDRYVDARQNLAAIASALKHFRGLDRIGMPAILERVMTTAFKTALPAHKESHVTTVAG